MALWARLATTAIRSTRGIMAASLQEVVSGSPAPSAAAPTPAPGPSASSETPVSADASHVESEGDETQAATPAATPDNAKPQDSRTVPYAALKDERRKRQELERNLAELQGQVKVWSQVAPQRPAEPQEKPEDVFYRDPVNFIEGRISREREALRQERIAMSEAMLREQHPDYDDVVQSFVEATKAAPHLVQQMHQHPHPAKFAYEAGKAYSQARQYGSIDEMRAKLREELRAEVLEELKRDQAQSAAQAVQPSIAGARGAGVSSPPRWQGPTPLKSICGR